MSSLPAYPHHDFTLLAKPSGAACNLACRYCFYLNKEQLYPKSRLHMSDEVLEEYIRQLLASKSQGEVNIAWQGGEPTLMGLDFFQHSVELVKKYRKPNQRVAYSLQTNGTLLDDEWCAFFKKHKFLIGISVDGTPEMHNAYRVNKAGQGSFDLARRGWNLLQKHDVETNILCAVHSANASQPLKAYHFLRDTLHATYIQFIPIVEWRSIHSSPAGKPNHNLTEDHGDSNLQAANEVSLRSVKPTQFGLFLTEVFDEWVHKDVGKVFIQNFEAALGSWCRLPASVCVFQEVCGSSLILEHNGDLYSCDHFVDAAHWLGNILEQPLAELVRSSRQRQFGLAKREQLPDDCRKCDVLFACHGECPRNRFVGTSEGDEDRLNYLCPSYKQFFHHVDHPMRVMRELLRLGRAPAEIIELA